jgi:glutathione S-transferase
MALKLHMHPLSSYCWKALIALYENETPFEPHLVDLGDEAARKAFLKLWPIAKLPVLRDDARDRTVPESSIIIEYLALHYPGRVALVPKDGSLAVEMRMRDRFYDLYVHEPTQKIFGDRRRPAGKSDPYGVEQAKATLLTSYGIIEDAMATRTWATGEHFGMADCAAAPALHYGNLVLPFGEDHPNVAAYLMRLESRPSFARVLREAKPHMHAVPK